jgi:predicted metalloprotease with PDZ domain
MRSRLPGFAALAMLAAVTAAQAATPPATSYTIAMPDPSSHFFHVTARFEKVRGPFTFAVPSWTPGGYVRDEVAGNVLDFAAADGSGRALPARKTDTRTWAIDAPRDGIVEVRYRVYANERGTPYGARLNASVGHANLARLLGFAPDRLAAPARVRFEPYGDWKMATSVPPEPAGGGWYAAADYDLLVDGIVILGRFVEESFDEGGAHWRMVFSQPMDFKKNDLVKDVRALTREAAAIFGVVPFKDYLFITLIEPEAGRGGIEHRDGTSMCAAAELFDDREKYSSYLGLVAHELVHAWNVKRLRPAGIGPYQYIGETPTKNLYVAEGFTTYLGPMALVRSGAVTREEFFKSLGERMVSDRDNAGMLAKSLEEQSWDWWLESKVPFLTYRSNYTRGSLVAWKLDYEIRTATQGARGVEDVMKGLYGQIATRATGYTDAELRQAFVRWGAPGMDARLDALVGRPGALDLAAVLDDLGLEMVPDPAAPAAVYVGWRTTGTGKEFPTVDWIEPGSPAAKAGLQDRDMIVAIGGRRVAVDRLDKDLAAQAAGKEVAVIYFRDRMLMESRMTPEAPRPAKVIVRPRGDASPEAKNKLEAWLAPKAKP